MMLQRISGLGSSPLARGLLLLVGDRVAVVGIIPACAGFTRPRRTAPAPRADHPRLRGVYAHACMGIHSMIGSSPLARGLLRRTQYCHFCGRIIPACAGFTPTPGSSTPHGPDHPRLRGVYLKTVDALVQTVGSSPLARGLLGARGIDRAGRRIIPACAGFTGARACSR